MTSRNDARFSTYSGAPSLQPSLAPTISSQPGARTSQARASSYQGSTQRLNEKSTVYSNNTDSASRASTSSIPSDDPKSADIKSWAVALERMQDKRLDKQRYTMNRTKSDEVSKLALGAKVERALARRMSSQDATFSTKKRIPSEKRSTEVEVN